MAASASGPPGVARTNRLYRPTETVAPGHGGRIRSWATNGVSARRAVRSGASARRTLDARFGPSMTIDFTANHSAKSPHDLAEIGSLCDCRGTRSAHDAR